MLRITLAINADQIADYEVRNIGPSTTSALYKYTVRQISDGTVGSTLAVVEHDRRDGVHALAAQVLLGLLARGIGDE